jgi:hypothetical protein
MADVVSGCAPIVDVADRQVLSVSRCWIRRYRFEDLPGGRAPHAGRIVTIESLLHPSALNGARTRSHFALASRYARTIDVESGCHHAAWRGSGHKRTCPAPLRSLV